MQRLTISLDDSMAEAIDAHMARNHYSNRSEALRDIIRGALAPVETAAASAECVAAISYVYDYDGRDLTARLDRAQHEHHDITIASMRTRLDHRNCMEVTLLRGPTPRVRDLGRTILAEKGVRFGQVNLVPVRSDTYEHSHGSGGSAHRHDTPTL